MEKYNQQHDLKVFGARVKTFPKGIGEAFDKLVKMLPSEIERPYYGVTECTKEAVIYKAAALETFDGEAQKYGYEPFIVEKGEYLAITVTDWLSKTECIKDVFQELCKDNRADTTKPMVEVYTNMKEMMCMVKVDQRKEAQGHFEAITNELIQVVSSFEEEQLNNVSHEGSWTAGQVVQHIIMSNSGFGEMLNGSTKETKRAIDEKIETIKRDFLDFKIKMNSPGVVLPPKKNYKKEDLLLLLQKMRESIDKAIQTLDLSKTCTAFELPMYGYLTRLEAVYFIIYHTQRHLHQLKNTAQKVL